MLEENVGGKLRREREYKEETNSSKLLGLGKLSEYKFLFFLDNARIRVTAEIT